MTLQIERLRPHQISEALARRNLVWLPLGTMEWHCHHLPVGLDSLTANGLCIAAAERVGGLVWPVLYYGTGGDHSDFPWTVMPGSAEIEALIDFTLKRLAQLGVAEVVLFSGHFADTQLEMIDRIADRWNGSGHAPRVTALSVNRAGIDGFHPDHAGLFETTLLDAVAPGLSDLGRLGLGEDALDRFDPNSPLWGIVGADPRGSAPVPPEKLLQMMVDWLVATVGS